MVKPPFTLTTGIYTKKKRRRKAERDREREKVQKEGCALIEGCSYEKVAHAAAAAAIIGGNKRSVYRFGHQQDPNDLHQLVVVFLVMCRN